MLKPSGEVMVITRLAPPGKLLTAEYPSVWFKGIRSVKMVVGSRKRSTKNWLSTGSVPVLVMTTLKANGWYATMGGVLINFGGATAIRSAGAVVAEGTGVGVLVG